MLTKEQIRKVDDLKIEVVKVPEWDASVKVKTMSGTEKGEFESATFKDGVECPPFRFRVMLCIFTVVDDKGSLVFGIEDADMLLGKSAKAIERISDVAQKLCGVGEKEIVSLEKN